MPENSLGASWLCNWEHGGYLHGDVLSCTLVTKQSLSLYFPVLCLIIGVGLEPRWNGYFTANLCKTCHAQCLWVLQGPKGDDYELRMLLFNIHFTTKITLNWLTLILHVIVFNNECTLPYAFQQRKRQTRRNQTERIRAETQRKLQVISVTTFWFKWLTSTLKE